LWEGQPARQDHQGEKMSKHGKKYLAAAAKVDPARAYEPREALALVKETSTTSFDGTVEIHMRMGLDPRQADQQVRKAGRLGRVLGPRGLMPNPKAGTVVPGEDLPRVIREAKAGRVEFRLDKTANLHIPIGKVSFDLDKLYGNMSALMEAIKKARPAAAKGGYIKRMTLTSTMAPGVRVDINLAQSMEATE